MTTLPHMSPARPAARSARVPGPWGRRLRNQLRTVFARGDFSSLVITWGIMLVTGMALDAAGWTVGLGALVYINLLSVGFGFLLARSHYSELLALILSSVYSLAAVLIVNAVVLFPQGSVWQRTDELLSQLWVWFNEATAGEQPQHDDIAFVVFLSVLFWYLGHNAAWHVFRVDRVWRVILPSGLVMVTNLFYYQGERPLELYLVIFVLLSLLLLIRSHIEAREYEWFVNRVSFPAHLRRTFFTVGGALALILVLVAWAAPTGDDDRSLDRVRELLSGETFNRWAELWNRLFSSLEAQGIATSDYYGGEELQLSGAVQLGDQPVMFVQAAPGPRYYWRSTVYDAYDFSAWRWRHVRTVRAYTDQPGLQFNIGTSVAGARLEVEQVITLLIRSSQLVYAAPQPVRLGLPVEAELDCVEDFQRTCVNDNRQADVAIIRARQTLRSGAVYTVRSSISTASAIQLRQAGQDYPDWVRRLYLQGAASVTPRVQELASQIIAQAGAQTPYDKAKAIERWLRSSIQYNESIPAPPRGSDPIEWFLFETREGYCNYYATAMVLMLRAQGVPARMAAGFAMGTWDAERGAYLVRERDAHTWVEVYFPGFGWVEFEPTADEAPIDRTDDPAPETQLPEMTPAPTTTPIPTLTPTSLAPTAPSGADATPTSPSQSPFLPSTPTPTSTPAPSATPPPPPDATRIDREGGSHVLRLILLTLGIVAMIVFIVIISVLMVIWYVEFRGLSGLNAVQRAYARLGIYARWLGMRFADSSTPEERRYQMVESVPEGDLPITTITRAYIVDRYGSPGDGERQAFGRSRAAEAWGAARRAMLQRKLRRWLGRDLPPEA